MKELFISFVLPAYNEEKNVIPLIHEITEAMNDITSNYEIVFVIEGEDKTLENLQKYKKEHPKIRINLIYQKEPLGLTNAFKEGFENVSRKTTHVVIMDVDLNHDPKELPRLIEKAKEGYNFVIGSREVKGSKIINVPIWKIAISKVANFIFSKAFGINIKDKTCGYWMIDLDTIREISPLVKSRDFEGVMEMLLVANKKRKSMVEVPITLTYRERGQTKFNLFKVGCGYMRLFLGGIK